MQYYYKFPKYFSAFECTGGDCPHSCCDGWRVDWLRHEYENLISADMSDGLRKRINDAFLLREDDKNMFCIKLCDDGRCPFHNRETDLCDIQKTIGEQYFGATCRRYPRGYFQSDDIVFEVCSMSCPAVIDKLIDDDNACVLDKSSADDYDLLEKYAICIDKLELKAAQPYTAYRNALMDFYSELFNKGNSIYDSVVLGALAARRISDASVNYEGDKIPGICRMFVSQINNPSILASLSSIETNYKIKYLIVNNICQIFFKDRYAVTDISVLHNSDGFIPDRYLRGKENFEKAFERDENWIKNIIINLFYELYVYLPPRQLTFFDIYMLFCAYAAVIEVLAYSIGYSSSRIKDEFTFSLANLARALTHGVSRAPKVVEYMKDIGIVSPAHIAMFIK